MIEKQHLEYEDFYNQLWGNIPAKVIDEDYVLHNKDFIDSITFDFYRLYELDNTLTMYVIRKMIESFFFNLFRFEPTLK